MDLISILVGLIFSIGVTLGVGSSTFALANFITALRDSVIDDSEKRMMRVVYFVLRVGMVLIGVGLVGSALLYGFPTYDSGYLMQWTMLIVITGNAILMTKHMMPMKYGPVLAGGSWYYLMLMTELPVYQASYLMLFVYYVIFLGIFYFVFEAAKKKFLPSKPTA